MILMCQLLLEAPSNRQKHLCESCTAMLVKFKITGNYWRLEEVCPPLKSDYIRIRSVTPAESMVKHPIQVTIIGCCGPAICVEMNETTSILYL